MRMRMQLSSCLFLLITASRSLAAQSATSNPFSEVSLSDAALLKVPPIVDGKAQTIIFPVLPGTDLTRAAPVFDVSSGTTVSPESGTEVDLSRPLRYKVTSNGTDTATWKFSAVHMGSPALPGLYADPNIVVFGDMYYIYSTTDGFPGWGGQVFYVWYSKDLITWSRTAEPVLVLNGTSGNVPWANGNAWAPTIAERYGKFYLYFSGNNPTFNWKTIGVAVGSSPTGPFKAEPTAMITNTGPINTSQAIDPAYFLDPKSGVHYLFWGNGHALMAELADNMTSIKDETITAVSGLENFTEASFVVYREPYYHYTYSYGNTDDKNYIVNYATAPNVTGPWTSRGTVLHQRDEQGIFATGSSSTVNVPGTDDWYMAYHRFQIPNGNGTDREICLNKISWKRDGVMNAITPTLQGVLKPEFA